MLGAAEIIAGVAGASLMTVCLLTRIFFAPSSESRVSDRGSASRAHGLATRVRGLEPWSRQHTETGAESRGGVQGQPPVEPVRTMGIGTVDQVQEFVDWTLARQEGHAGKWSDDGVYLQYRLWAKQGSVIEMPRCLFLKVLYAHPNVTRKRELILDKNGFAIPHPSGKSKLRDTFYTIWPKPKKAPRKPADKAPLQERFAPAATVGSIIRQGVKQAITLPADDAEQPGQPLPVVHERVAA